MSLVGRKLLVSFEDHLGQPTPVRGVITYTQRGETVGDHVLVFRLEIPFVHRGATCEVFAANARPFGPSYQQSVFDLEEYEDVYCAMAALSPEHADGPVPCDLRFRSPKNEIQAMGTLWLDELPFSTCAAKVGNVIREVWRRLTAPRSEHR